MATQVFSLPKPEDEGNGIQSNIESPNTAIRSIASFYSQSQSSKSQEASQQDENHFILNLLQKQKVQDTFGTYRLKGVVIISNKLADSKRAIIEDLATDTTHTYWLNSVLADNSQLVDIQKHHIILQKNGMRMRLYIHNLSAEQVGEQRAYLEKTQEGFARIGFSEYVVNPYLISRNSVNNLLESGLGISAPNGTMEGIQISGVGSNSLARKLGLMENDVILTVNQKQLDNLSNVIMTGINAHKSDELRLEIRRGDRIIPLTYHLFWEGKSSWNAVDLLNTKPIFSLLRELLTYTVF
jgi:type II secretory pathway component PulC